jgi:hypothetical protein
LANKRAKLDKEIIDPNMQLVKLGSKPTLEMLKAVTNPIKVSSKQINNAEIQSEHNEIGFEDLNKDAEVNSQGHLIQKMIE